MQYELAACTDVGTRKKVNQDSLHACVAKTGIGEIVMAVICDGVGGLSCGEVASSKTVYAFKNWFKNSLPSLIGTGVSLRMIEQEWTYLISQINREIIKISEEQSVQMGTTLTVAIFLNGEYLIAQVGDSRIYEIGNGQLIQLTTDQTFVEREVQLGHMTREQAMTDQRRHVLLQCLGLNEVVEPQFSYGKQNIDSNYLFCTDGFYNCLLPQEIYKKCSIKGKKIVLEEQLKEMIELCKNRGERDNISAILLGA